MIIRQPNPAYADFCLADVPASHEPFRLLNRIPITDNGEPLVDLRETNRDLSFAEDCLPYVRSSIAEALDRATQLLPSHLELKVYSALRTLEKQAEMYCGNYDRARESHPTWSKAVLRRTTNRFFAPPDAKAPPGHCTGGAVDVGLHVRESGEGLDLRSPLEGWRAAPTHADGLSPEAAENRRLLCFAMHSTGLSNCRDEYWHWSYGDSAWAVRVGASSACYGLIEPPAGANQVFGKVLLKPYDPDWPRQFETIRPVLCEALGAGALRIEHVGSTSVPGLSAKPVLDIDIVIADGTSLSEIIEALAGLGYQHQGDLGIAGREAFRPRQDEESKDAPSRAWPEHNLYACLNGARELRRHLAFRDYLRANAVAVRDYGELKSRLAEQFPWDRVRYTFAKDSFIHGILREIDLSLMD